MKAVGSLRDSDRSPANAIVRSVVGKLDGSTVLRTQPVPEGTTLFVQWGFKLTVALLSAIDARIPFVIIDLGYFDGSRLRRFSISINGLHGLSMPVKGIDKLPPRWHPEIKDWQEGGEFVVVYGQLPSDAAVRGVNIETWMHKTARECVAVFGKPARKRLHPKMLNVWEPPLTPLEQTFEETFLAVTWTSGVAVQTVLAGVPTVTCHPASPAWDVTPHILERYTRLEISRELWAHRLSHREYDLYDDKDLDRAVGYIIRAYPQATREAAVGNVDSAGKRI